jgi:LDH2 family malate/lactate/ureidoglycolate dehydrogenase
MTSATESTTGIRRFPISTVRTQIANVLSGLGMPADQVSITADAMVDADACGIDTHGISLLVTYDDRCTAGTLTINPTIELVHETAVSAVFDAGGGLGYVPGVAATELAIAKAREIGMAGVAVRNSNHFGAAGYYTRMMAAAGLIGMSGTNGAGGRAAPTRGKEAKLSTNPLAFAAPTRRNPVFHLDMATTTIAAGKIRVKANENLPIPVGWVNDENGAPLTDPTLYDLGSRYALTPLGGTEEGSSFKGYGLSAMVEILSVGLSGASLVTSEGHGTRTPGTMDIGHFFLAIDPRSFRTAGEFEDDMDSLIDDLHATAPVDPGRPVLVAGEREDAIRRERAVTGVPVPPGLREKIREIASRAGATFLLD